MTRTPNELYEEVNDALTNAASPLEVDAIFDNLKSTSDAATVKFVVDKMDKEQEKYFWKNIAEDPISKSERKGMLAETKEADAATDPYEIALAQEDLEDGQGQLQIVLNIAKIRGDEASPVTKAFVEEIKKLSTEEYNSQSGLMQAMFSATDKLVAAAPKTTLKANPSALDKTRAAPKP